MVFLELRRDSRVTRVRSLGWEDPLEKGMATHSSILAWRIPWAEEPSGLQSTEKGMATHCSILAWRIPWAEEPSGLQLDTTDQLGSDSKESACNVGKLGLISRSGRSSGEENGYPLQQLQANSL